MAFLFNRSIIRCHNLSLIRNAGGNLGLRTNVSLSLRLLHSGHRRALPVLSSVTSHASTNCEGVKRDSYIQHQRRAVSRILPVYSSATAFRNIVLNGARQLTTSTPLQASSQSSDGPLVYKGNLNTLVKILKIFSLTSSALGCVVVPLILYNSTSVINVIFASFASLTILTPLLLHWFTKGYVTHMYFNREQDTYTALTYTFVLTSKRLQFTPDDVDVPAIRNIFTSFTAKGVPLLVDDRRFANPNDVMHLKGYDKKLGDLSLEEIKKLYEKEEEFQKQ